MKRHILLILLLFNAYLLAGSTWIRSYPWLDLCTQSYTSAQARAYNVIPAIGGGYLLQGHVEFYNNDSMRLVENVFWKIDDNGSLIWRRLGHNMFPHNIVISNGLDRYFCIENESGASRLDVYDSELNWLVRYQFNQVNGFNADIRDAVLTSDGLVLAAKVDGYAVILKTDFEFNLIWQGDSFSTGWSDGYNTIKPYSGGWVAGSEWHFAHMTATGDTLWTYTGPVNPIAFNDCIVTTDNRIICTGLTSYMGMGYLFLYEIDIDNHSVSIITDGLQYGFSEALESMIEGPNGEIIILCYASNNTVLHAYDRMGSHLWSRDFYPNLFYFLGEGTNNLMATSDGGVLFCTMGGNGVTLVKTDSNGNVVANEDPILTPSTITTSHYPNPTQTYLTIDYKTEKHPEILQLEVFNIRGQLVYSSPLTSGEGSHQIDLCSSSGYRFSPGVYMYRVRDGRSSTSATKRFIVYNGGN